MKFNIKKVKIGANIETIGRNAFNGAINLKNIVINSAKITKVSKGAFSNIAENAVFKIRASSKEYENIVKQIKASGVGKNVRFERLK